MQRSGAMERLQRGDGARVVGTKEPSVLVIPSDCAPRFHRLKLKEICGRASAQAASRICALDIRRSTGEDRLGSTATQY
jgi:hypothetical protein